MEDVDLIGIALRVASEEITGYSPSVLRLVTDEMREEMNIDPKQIPYEEGSYSVVYDTKDDNIVVFTLESTARDTARLLLRNKIDVLPEVYRVEVFNLDDNPYPPYYSKIYAIEMEKLAKPLNVKEKLIFEANSDRIISGVDEKEARDPESGELNDYMFGKMEELANEAEELGIRHTDLHGENVMWDKDGDLKFIDLESVNLDDYELDAPHWFV
jgi:thiamine kinase-like enzyme